MNLLRRLLRSFARWVLSSIQAQPDEIDRAVRGAFGDSGLNLDDYSDDFNLKDMGKFNDVLFHSVKRLGISFQTVGDVKGLLR